MPRIRCFYIDCVFLDDGFCGANAIEVDPDTGCNTYKRSDSLNADDDWEDENDELEEWDEMDLEEDDPWIEDDK